MIFFITKFFKSVFVERDGWCSFPQSVWVLFHLGDSMNRKWSNRHPVYERWNNPRGINAERMTPLAIVGIRPAQHRARMSRLFPSLSFTHSNHPPQFHRGPALLGKQYDYGSRSSNNATISQSPSLWLISVCSQAPVMNS